VDVPEGEDHEGRWFLLGSRGETFETTAYASDRDIAVIYYVHQLQPSTYKGNAY